MAAGATRLYYNLAKLGRVQLPGGTSYALIDYNGRELIAEIFNANTSYDEGEYILYSPDGYGSELFQFTQAHPAGVWNLQHVRGPINVGEELNRLESLIAGGIHYRGKTSTALYDGAPTNPITINGASYTAEQGDMVIVNRSAVKVDYAIGTAYEVHTYILNDGIYYITNAAITSTENTSIDAIREKLDVVKTDPEFLFDGTIWNVLGSVAEGLGDLAFKDSASGSYTAPTGSGSVTVNDYSASKKKLSTTTIYGVASDTVNVSRMTAGTAISVARAGTAVRYGTADVGTAVKYGTADRAAQATRYGTADVDSPVAVGTSLSGTTTFNTNAIKSAALTGTKTFNTDAIKSATLTGTKTFTTAGITTSVTEDCLAFAAAATATVGIETTPASTATVGIETTPASTATVTLTTTNITPAVEAASSQTIYGAINAPDNQTLTPATAAPNNQTIVPAVSNGTITPWSKDTGADIAVAKGPTLKTVATGSLEDGDQIVIGITGSASSKSVTVGTTSSTVVVD